MPERDTLLSDDIRRREKARRRSEPLWGALSLLLHVAFFAATLLLTPVRKLVVPEKAPQPNETAISSSRLMAMSETLSAAHLAELLRHVAELQTILHNMDVLKEAAARDYDRYAERLAPAAKEELERLVEETAAAQTSASAAQKEVKAEIAKMVEIEQDAAVTNAAVYKDLFARADRMTQSTSEKTATPQANAVNALDRLHVKARFAGYAKTAEVAETLREAQIEAARMQESAQRDVTATAEKMVEMAKKKKPLDDFRREKANDAQMARVEEAEKAQAAVNERIAALRETLAADTASRPALAKGASRKENPLAEAPPPAEVAAAYELAQKLEDAVTESYRDVKATRTAILRQMDAAAAKEITDVAKPQRLQADAKALAAHPRTAAEFDARKAAEGEVVREAKLMSEAALALMEDAMRIALPDAQPPPAPNGGQPLLARLEEADLEKRDSEDALDKRIAEMAEEAEYQVAMEAAAAEDSEAKAKDIAALMAKRSGETPPPEGDVPKEAPPLKGGDPLLQPGNIMRSAGTPGVPAQWMYVSSWHVIGPFPNPNRVNLRRKFAPESVQDLDATYIGKDGRTVRWEFMQARNRDNVNQWGVNEKNAAEVIPRNREEYAIFYAYAEVVMDEECDRWVAIGSDDRSDVWVNGVPVWGSSNKLKAWKLAEDFRRVHFRKGRNTILARVENGHWNFGWSLCISTVD
ncbi:MAG: hypothetical protein IJQ73_10870 [Kiritimatiellae bacterium]|nr:hypothetical protein [Kiritimatiellia bacterium]